MAVNPDDLFKAAKTLIQSEDEVSQRNAASRAYYAAYHRCLALSLHLRLEAALGHGVHARLRDALYRSKDSRVRSIAYILNECRKHRGQADYEIEQDFSPEDARTAINQCERIMTKANALTQKSTPRAITPHTT